MNTVFYLTDWETKKVLFYDIAKGEVTKNYAVLRASDMLWGKPGRLVVYVARSTTPIKEAYLEAAKSKTPQAWVDFWDYLINDKDCLFSVWP